MSEGPLWTPSSERIARARLTAFIHRVNRERGLALSSYDALWSWSIAEPAAFWQAVWDDADLIATTPPTRVLDGLAMPGARWFEGATLNFAANLLRRRDDHPALRFETEAGGAPVVLSHAELYTAVARLARFLAEQGVGPGDRVAAFVPNRPESVIGMLAATSLGAIWSSCSPDFGFKGVMDRFGQIAPKVLLAAVGYTYNGRHHDLTERITQVVAEIPSIERTVLLDGDLPVRGAIRWERALANDATEVAFAALPFDHPVYILYSSGTTGVPKCIVHGAGGTLLQHHKELALHCDVRADDALFYFTTCGWMMWNWLVSGLMRGATVVLYDGSPAHPTVDVLWELAERARITHFGTSPKFLGACQKAGITPGSEHDLAALRVLLSTGSPLSDDLFRWVYANVSPDLHLASISGGTDIISCFMGGSPIDPVYAGEIQKRGLGMAVDAWDDAGHPIRGDKGELVCTAPFPSMPVGFWNDPDGSAYHRAYFDHFPGVWRHGDWIEITGHGGVVVHGRSDATLNPGGVRIGTAEIYRQVEAMPEVVDAVVVGQRWHDDVRVVLFVVLRPGRVLDPALIGAIRSRIRDNTTPRHVPALVLQAPDVPRTLSGKKVELAVARMIHGEPVKNRDALANPESLDFFADVPELRA